MAYPIKTLNRAVELGADISLFDQNVNTYRNGERGIHHFLSSCVKLNNPNPVITSKGLLSLNDRVCYSCFEDSLTIDLRKTFNFVREIIATINVVDRHLNDIDPLKLRRATNTIGELEMLAQDLESNISLATELAGSGFSSTIRKRIALIRKLGTLNIESFRSAITRAAASKFMSREYGTGERAPFVTDADDAVLGYHTVADGTPTLVTVASYRNWLRNVYEHGDYQQARSSVISLVLETSAEKVDQLANLVLSDLSKSDDILSSLQSAWSLQRDSRIQSLLTMWESTHKAIMLDNSIAIVGIKGSWVPEEFAASITAVYRPYRYQDYTLIAVPLALSRWFSQPGNAPRTTLVANLEITAGKNLESVQKIAETAVTLWSASGLNTAASLNEAVTSAALL
jgi:hypothetical protein